MVPYMVKCGDSHWVCRYNKLDGIILTANQLNAKIFNEAEYGWARYLAKQSEGNVLKQEGSSWRDIMSYKPEATLSMHGLRERCCQHNPKVGIKFDALIQDGCSTQKVGTWLKALDVYRGFPIVRIDELIRPEVYALCEAIGSAGIPCSVVSQLRMGGSPSFGLLFGFPEVNAKVLLVE